MFCWGSAGRLRPMRMVWPDRNHNEPRYELAKWHHPSLRGHSRMSTASGSKVEWDRETRQRFPGETGRWPLNRRKRRKGKRI